MRRILAALAGLTVMSTLLIGTPAQGIDILPQVWHRCETQVLTWTLYVPLGVKGVDRGTERRLAEAAFTKVYESSRYKYKFQYVAPQSMNLAWGTHPAGPEWEKKYPPYTSSPKVDIIVTILPDKAPSPASQAYSYSFNGNLANILRDWGPYALTDGSTATYLVKSVVLYNAPKFRKKSVAERRKGYMWGALAAVGIPQASWSATINTRDRGMLDSQVSRSCAAVALSPTVVPMS